MKNIITCILSCMENKRLIKWYKKWCPAFWTSILSFVFVVFIACGVNLYGANYLDSTRRTTDSVEREVLINNQRTMGKVYRDHLNALFEKWDSILDEDRKDLVTAMKTLSTCMAVWVGIIAAICTILPIVLGINANLNFRNELEHTKKQMQEKMLGVVKDQETKLDAKAQKTEDKLSNKFSESKKKLEELTNKQKEKIEELEGKLQSNIELSQKSQVNQTLSDLAVHIRVIAELQDFESKDRGTLSKAELLPRVLRNVMSELEKAKEGVSNRKQDENVFLGLLLLLCMLKRLLTSTETVFVDYELLTLQQLRAKIDKEVTEKMKKTQDEIDNSEIIKGAILYTRKVWELFDEFAKKQKQEGGSGVALPCS